ncbi:MAG: RDD family protein [Saprospiraceae bacterium]
MIKEKFLVLLLGIQIIIAVYYLPVSIDNLQRLLEGNFIDNLGFLIGTISRYGFTIIGGIGLVKYLQDKDINNTYLRLCYFFFAIEFILSAPATLMIYLRFDLTTNFMFFFFNILATIKLILTVLVYGTQLKTVQFEKKATASIRLSHHFVDSLALTLLALQLRESYQFLLGIGILSEFYLVYFFSRFFYYLIAESIFQQTFGKMITKHYVTQMDGGKASFGQILKRSLVRMIPFEAVSLLAQPWMGWHDSLSDTNVYPLSEQREVAMEDYLLDHLVEKEAL